MDEIKNVPVTEEQDLSEILKIRREKLDALISAGKNPFEKVRYDRTAYSQDVKDDYASYEGKSVGIAGRLISKRITNVSGASASAAASRSAVIE